MINLVIDVKLTRESNLRVREIWDWEIKFAPMFEGSVIFCRKSWWRSPFQCHCGYREQRKSNHPSRWGKWNYETKRTYCPSIFLNSYTSVISLSFMVVIWVMCRNQVRGVAEHKIRGSFVQTKESCVSRNLLVTTRILWKSTHSLHSHYDMNSEKQLTQLSPLRVSKKNVSCLVFRLLDRRRSASKFQVPMTLLILWDDEQSALRPLLSSWLESLLRAPGFSISSTLEWYDGSKVKLKGCTFLISSP